MKKIMLFKNLFLALGLVGIIPVINASDINYELLKAVRNNQPTQVQSLLEQGANPNQIMPHSFNASLLHEAAAMDMVEITQLLIKHGANINAQDQHGNTPLHRAAKNAYNIQTTQILLKTGANQMIANKEQDLPWHATGENPELEISHAISILLLQFSLKLRMIYWIACHRDAYN